MKTTGFFYGISTFLNSFKTLFTVPKLLRYALLPSLINLIILSLILYFGFSYYGTLMHFLLPEHTVWWKAIIYWISWIIFPIIFLMLLFYTFVTLACIISSPFLEILSSKYLAYLHPSSIVSEKPAFKKIMWEETKKISILLLIALVAFPLNFIPIIGNLLYYLISILLFAFEFIDYPMSVSCWSFKQRYRFIFKNFFTSIGFGAVITLSFIVPFIGFICLPVSTIAATKIFNDNRGALN